MSCVAEHDGNGWVQCRCGQRHWGLHGAAGLVLLRAAGPARGRPAGYDVLLQLRAVWTHEGGSWGLPGGARDSHEDVVGAALREAHEETGVRAEALSVLGCVAGVDHVDWRYTYVVATAPDDVEVAVSTGESDELRWVGLDDVPRLPLHTAFGASWPALRADLSAVLAMADAQPRADRSGEDANRSATS